jgi:hypothetical protein
MSRYAFRAGAAAAGGFFTRPFTEPLPVQAASFLMPVGGYGSARVEQFRYHEIVSFSAGYTQVMGTVGEQDGTTVFETLASAVVEGLNILDVVTADRVVARLTSQTRDDGKPSELSALVVGSHFENLRIAGVPVRTRCHSQLLEPRTATKSTFVDSKPAVFDADSTDDTGPVKLPRDAATLRFSIFQPLDGEVDGAKTFPGCRISIPSFGDIFLGEYVVSARHRQLTMIRIDLHSPEEGALAVASVEGNGSVY